jgi:Uncharacterized Fe-S protein
MKDNIREYILSIGGDLCGFANIDSFYDAPEGFSPKDVWKECKSVISIAVSLPKGLFQISPRLVYAHYNQLSCSIVDEISFKTAKYIEHTYNCKAIPMPCDSPYEYWREYSLEGRGLLSMKHIAVKAGLGSIGKNSLFACKEYGNMVTLGCVLIDLELKSDNIRRNICIDGCSRCVDSCPVSAISNDFVNQKRCRNNTYGKTARGFDTVDCNICRTVCPLNKVN